MTDRINKRVLIVGSSAKEYALAKKLSAEVDVFVAPGNSTMKDFAVIADIREENVKDLLEFALENAIDLTIVSSEIAIKNNIAGLFHSNGQMIFSPSAQSSAAMINKAEGKRFLYKLHIPTPRFGVFEKQPLAMDYIKNAKYPIVIRTEESNNKDRLLCPSIQLARTFLDDLFIRGETKVVIEEYAYGHEFTFYVITDGYSVLPMTTAANYKFMLEGDGGLLTSGVGSYAPDFKLSPLIKENLMKTARNIVSSIERRGFPYVGIVGIEGIVTENDKYVVLELKPFLGDHDCQAVLNLIDENLVNIFEACANGSFADDYTSIKTNDMCAVSCVLHSGVYMDKVITGLDLLDDCEISCFNNKKNSDGEYLTCGDKTLVITKTAKTLSRASKSLYEEIDCIKFDGKKYRKDICNTYKDGEF